MSLIGKLRKSDFSISETIEETTSNDKFELHEHDDYEILFFLEGDSRFVIEGKNYFLEPGDVVIIRKHEMHRVYHNSSAPYHRVVLMIKPDFFINHNCPDYEKQFSDPHLKIGNRIKADYVHSCGLYDSFMRFKKYSGEYSLENEPVIESTIMEILYLINRIGNFSSSDEHNTQIEQIISYINNHYTEDLNLETMEKTFFLSKYYLCKFFRKTTGLTIHEYISRKRLAKVREHRQNGKSISDAAMLSGFSDYSSFYRTYKKLMGCAPKEDVNKFYMDI